MILPYQFFGRVEQKIGGIHVPWESHGGPTRSGEGEERIGRVATTAPSPREGVGDGVTWRGFIPLPPGFRRAKALRHPLARGPAKHRMQLSALRANWLFPSSSPYESKLSTDRNPKTAGR